jgi:hypothetical protein
MKIVLDDPACLAIKRFNLPATLFVPCPKCGTECNRRFDGDDYISYPPIDGAPTDVYMDCARCKHAWTVPVMITFRVSV